MKKDFIKSAVVYFQISLFARMISHFRILFDYILGSIDDIEVPIDYRTARALHSCWSSNYHPNVVHKERQLKKGK